MSVLPSGVDIVRQPREVRKGQHRTYAQQQSMLPNPPHLAIRPCTISSRWLRASLPRGSRGPRLEPERAKYGLRSRNQIAACGLHHRRNNGKHLLVLSSSHFDPTRALGPTPTSSRCTTLSTRPRSMSSSSNAHLFWSGHAQVRQDIGARTNLVARSLKITTDGFKGAAEMPSKKSLGYCDVGKSVWWFLEPVSFVRINDVGHRNILCVHRGNDRIAFCHSAAHIIGTVKDEHRLPEILDLVDGGAFAEQLAAFLRARSSRTAIQ